MLFDDLKVTSDILKKHFFKYLQLRRFILTRLKRSFRQPPLSTLESFSTQNCFSKGRVAHLYKILVNNNKDNTERKRCSKAQLEPLTQI